MNTEIIVPFYADSIRVIHTDNGPFVPIKPISSRFGLDDSGQRQRVMRQKALYGAVVLPSPSGGGEQEMTCIPLNRVAMWLATIQTKMVKEDCRDALELYQIEAADVLDRYFRRDHAQLSEQFNKVKHWTLVGRPLWAKVYHIHMARVDRAMVFRHLGKSFEETLGIITEMEEIGIIDPFTWADNAMDPHSAVAFDRTVNRAYEEGYTDPSGEMRSPRERQIEDVRQRLAEQEEAKTGLEAVLEGDCDA